MNLLPTTHLTQKIAPPIFPIYDTAKYDTTYGATEVTIR
jgi:hypothetical protein